jgi:hypothetical protein
MGKTHTQYLTLGTSGSLAKKPTHGHLTQETSILVGQNFIPFVLVGLVEVHV